MGRRTGSSRRGSRFTPPQPRVRDTRRAELYAPDFVAQVRAQSAPQCLGLEGVQHLAPPPGLAQLEYRCDMPGLTGFAGMPAFMKFCYGLGLADRVAALPLSKRSSVYSPGKLCEVVVELLVAGLSRVSHVDFVTHDEGLCEAVGLPRLPDQATLSRFFGDATPNALSHLRQVNREFSRQTVAQQVGRRRLVVDGDTRVVGVYGKQEGAKASPRNNGDPQFTFEITTLRNTHDILDGGLLEGVTHPAPLFAERFATVVAQLGTQTDELIWCGDAAWYSAAILQTIEAADVDEEVPCACKYAIRAQMTDHLLKAVRALPEDAWRPCEEDVQIAEVRHAFTRTRSGQDVTQRRYVVTRKALPQKPSPVGQAVLVPAPHYEYWAIVTNLTWKPRQVLSFYNQRATVETILKEGALGFHMDSLPSESFAGNGLYCQLLVLAYNHVNLFRRLCLPAEQSQHYVQSLRRLVLAVPGWIEHTAQRLVTHCETRGPHVTLLPRINAMVERWLTPELAHRSAPAAT